jgi:hypothetical protein
MKLLEFLMSLLGTVLVLVGIAVYVYTTTTANLEPTVYEAAVFIVACGGYTYAVFSNSERDS